MAGSRSKTRYPGIYRLPSGLFQVLYRAGGRQHSQSFERLADARAFQAATKTALDRGTWTDPAGGKTLLCEWVQWWTDHRSVSDATEAKTRTLLDHYLLPTFGNMPLGRIDPQTVKAWVREIESRGKARGTVQAAYKLLAQIMAEAVEADLIARSPVRGVKLAAGPPARAARALTTEEAARLLAALGGGSPDVTHGARFRQPGSVATTTPQVKGSSPQPPPPYTLVLTLLGTGMRFGEAAGLRRRRVQLLRRPPTIEVAEALHEVNGRLTFGPPKTQSSLRTIPLPSVVAQTLAAHLPANGDPADLVFRSPRGVPLRRTNFSAAVWWPALERAGLGRVRLHDCRHLYASILENGGVPRAVTAELLGHAGSSSGMTGRYAHAFQQVMNEAAEIVDAWLREALGGPVGKSGIGDSR